MSLQTKVTSMIDNQYENKIEVQEKHSILRLLSRAFSIVAAIDTCVLWRLFEGDWKSKEFKIYQNFFALVVVPTVYKEFLSMQGQRFYSIVQKDNFLKLLDVDVRYPSSAQKKSGDNQILDELQSIDISLFITDNIRHFEGLTVEVMDSRKVSNLFADFN